MNTVLLTMLVLSFGTDGNHQNSIPAEYTEIYQQAVYNCHRARAERINTEIVRDLIIIESEFFETHNIDSELRGMLLIAACNESGFNTRARGDWRTNSRGRRVSKAHGILQLWPWWENSYNIDRDNYKEAARAWMSHIVMLKQKNDDRRRCPSSFSEKRKWIAAWVQTTRGRTNAENRFRCFQTPSHYRHLQRWQQEIRKLKGEFECQVEIEYRGRKLTSFPCEPTSV